MSVSSLCHVMFRWHPMHLTQVTLDGWTPEGLGGWVWLWAWSIFRELGRAGWALALISHRVGLCGSSWALIWGWLRHYHIRYATLLDANNQLQCFYMKYQSYSMITFQLFPHRRCLFCLWRSTEFGNLFILSRMPGGLPLVWNSCGSSGILQN